MNPSISLQNVSKVYRIFKTPQDRFKEALSLTKKRYSTDHYALNNITLDIDEGDIVGIIGVNGSGKSTLLKIITGVLTPTTGNVKVNGKISALLELGAGFNPDYTGVENIYFSGLLMGFSKTEMDKKVQGIIDFADIGDFINQPVKTYSSGMYVRLAYAVAVSIEPDILIVDEALAVGDAFFQLKSMTRMQELFNKGKTVLFVSHDTASIKSLCKKALYLHKGEIIAYGPVKEIVEMYEQDIRDVMSSTIQSVNKCEIDKVDYLDAIQIKKKYFYRDNAFITRVEKNREGDGRARVVSIQLLNNQYVQISDVDFNMQCILRLCIEFNASCSVCVGYHIRDNKNIVLLGSSTMYELDKLIQGNEKECYIVDFKFNLPLIEGQYNVMSVLSEPLSNGQAASFIDLTKDGFYFNVLQAKPYRIWNKVQIPNTIDIQIVK